MEESASEADGGRQGAADGAPVQRNEARDVVRRRH